MPCLSFRGRSLQSGSNHFKFAPDFLPPAAGKQDNFNSFHHIGGKIIIPHPFWSLPALNCLFLLPSPLIFYLQSSFLSVTCYSLYLWAHFFCLPSLLIQDCSQDECIIWSFHLMHLPSQYHLSFICCKYHFICFTSWCIILSQVEDDSPRYTCKMPPLLLNGSERGSILWTMQNQ